MYPASRYSPGGALPLLSRSSSVGSASGLAMPKFARLGPIPRTRILSFPLLPPRIKPAIKMLSAVPTKARVLILASFESTAWLTS